MIPRQVCPRCHGNRREWQDVSDLPGPCRTDRGGCGGVGDMPVILSDKSMAIWNLAVSVLSATIQLRENNSFNSDVRCGSGNSVIFVSHGVIEPAVNAAVYLENIQ